MSEALDIREKTPLTPPDKEPLITGGQTFSSVTEKISSITEGKTTKEWLLLFSIAGSLLMLLIGVIGYLFWEGTGIWGLNNPVGWGWAIVNFVWWVGIGHAGTLISAILFLLRQKWRTSINRFAEAMTLFAVLCALLFPAIHVGRAWVLYWFFPIPNQMGMWPNFRSPLLWDFFRRGDIFHSLRSLLVYRVDSRSGHASRSRKNQDQKNGVWHIIAGLAWWQPAMAKL